VARHRRGEQPLSQQEVPERLRALVKPPLAVVLGSPAEVVNLLAGLGDAGAGATCYQMDLFQAERLRAELAEAGLSAEVVTRPDVWDLPADFQTAVYLPPRGGERELKLDMVEQAFHVLRPHGQLAVWSSHSAERLFPPLLKKIFGHVRNDDTGAVHWAAREKDRPRRRHEVTFQARIVGGEPCRFLSRPGTFAYGRFDEGSRALAEVAEVEPGDRVADLGCGVGTNGVFAGRQAGPTGRVAFVDSNVRAVALAELNARANGLTTFDVVPTSTVTGPGLDDGTFDVVLANPPYIAGHSVTRLFIARARQLLTPQGRLYLVTKQPNQVVEFLDEVFGAAEALMHRGYTILTA
jgi:16S rRNA (guanine1207-N2)-methyltransferase